MKQVPIQNLQPGLVKGVTVALPQDFKPSQNHYFEWSSAPLTARFATEDVTGGVLKAWRHEPVFTKAEVHIDDEMFYFLSGTALMMFVDYKDGVPDADTAQIVRIAPGTQLIIEKGKGHYVAVAEGTEPVLAVVVAPPMDAPNTDLSEPVLGI